VTVEAEVKAPFGEVAEELEQRKRVSDLRGAETHGRPIAENDVGNVLEWRVEL
jgi:hypothetical protein